MAADALLNCVLGLTEDGREKNESAGRGTSGQST